MPGARGAAGPHRGSRTAATSRRGVARATRRRPGRPSRRRGPDLGARPWGPPEHERAGHRTVPAGVAADRSPRPRVRVPRPTPTTGARCSAATGHRGEEAGELTDEGIRRVHAVVPEQLREGKGGDQAVLQQVGHTGRHPEVVLGDAGRAVGVPRRVVAADARPDPPGSDRVLLVVDVVDEEMERLAPLVQTDVDVVSDRSREGAGDANRFGHGRHACARAASHRPAHRPCAVFHGTGLGRSSVATVVGTFPLDEPGPRPAAIRDRVTCRAGWVPDGRAGTVRQPGLLPARMRAPDSRPVRCPVPGTFQRTEELTCPQRPTWGRDRLSALRCSS